MCGGLIMVCVPSFHTQTEILGGGLVQTDNGPAAILSLQTVDMQLTAAHPPVHQIRNLILSNIILSHLT